MDGQTLFYKTLCLPQGVQKDLMNRLFREKLKNVDFVSKNVTLTPFLAIAKIFLKIPQPPLLTTFYACHQVQLTQ